MNSNLRPLARTEGFLTEELDDELLVYNEGSDTACRLNRTAALVWQNADGHRSIADLVEVLRPEVELADEDLVLVTLDRLHENGLIESGYEARSSDEARLSRRRFIRRVGVVGAAALALPVVQSIVAPSVAAAQSGHIPFNGMCKCPCYCYCGAYSCQYVCSCGTSCASCKCATCSCQACDGQAGSCLVCSSCSSCSTCSCYCTPCGSCGTCQCGTCGYCTGQWYCSSCYCSPSCYAFCYGTCG